MQTTDSIVSDGNQEPGTPMWVAETQVHRLPITAS